MALSVPVKPSKSDYSPSNPLFMKNLHERFGPMWIAENYEYIFGGTSSVYYLKTLMEGYETDKRDKRHKFFWFSHDCGFCLKDIGLQTLYGKIFYIIAENAEQAAAKFSEFTGVHEDKLFSTKQTSCNSTLGFIYPTDDYELPILLVEGILPVPCDWVIPVPEAQSNIAQIEKVPHPHIILTLDGKMFSFSRGVFCGESIYDESDDDDSDEQ